MLNRIAHEWIQAARNLRRSPAYAATLICILSLGIGANTAIFSVVNSAVLYPAGIPEPDRLVVPRVKYTSLSLDSISLSPRDLGDLRQLPGVFSSITAVASREFNYRAEMSAVRLSAAAVNPEFFDVMGTRPKLGRTFLPEEDLPGNANVAVLSDRLWRNAFGADPNVIGREMRLNGDLFRIAGVMPADFTYPPTAELWVPLALAPAQYTAGVRRDENLLVIGRLAQGVEFRKAAANIGVLSSRILGHEYRDIGADGWQMFAMPFQTFHHAATGRLFTILMIAVGLVLLIACSNIAGLMLALASRRSREYAVRVALGAGRGHILSQALAESTLLSAAAGLAGLLMGPAGARILLTLEPPELAAGVVIKTYPFVSGFALLLTGLTALLTGVAPGLHMYRTASLGGPLASRAASAS